MGQLSQFLRKSDSGFAHYCPGCRDLHYIATSKPNSCGAQWRWDGNITAPTLQPSILIRMEDPDKEFPTEVCHYFLKAGVIEYLNDCTHALKGCKISLPALPEDFRDKCIVP